MDLKTLEKWRKNFPNPDDAAIAVKEALGCSISKAQKIVSGRYPSTLVLSEKRALAELFGCKLEILFPSAA